MKKDYIKPTTDVINIQPSRILCFSSDEDFFIIPDFGGELA